MKRIGETAEARQVNADPSKIVSTKAEFSFAMFLKGLTQYHSAVLSRTGLTKKECDFRTNKLSFILDLIREIGIPENLKTELTSAIIDAWRLQVPEISLEQRELELKKVMGSINCVRTIANWIERSASPMNPMQLNFKVLSALPLAPSDLQSEDAPKIYDLLSGIMEYCTSVMGEGVCHDTEYSSL
jgi:hypothetical protein